MPCDLIALASERGYLSACAMLSVEEAVVEGWCSVEELVRWGFGHSPVVMANEAHSGADALRPDPGGRSPDDPGSA